MLQSAFGTQTLASRDGVALGGFHSTSIDDEILELFASSSHHNDTFYPVELSGNDAFASGLPTSICQVPTKGPVDETPPHSGSPFDGLNESSLQLDSENSVFNNLMHEPEKRLVRRASSLLCKYLDLQYLNEETSAEKADQTLDECKDPRPEPPKEAKIPSVADKQTPWKPQGKVETELKSHLVEEGDLDCDLRCLVACTINKAKTEEDRSVLEYRMKCFDKCLVKIENCRLLHMKRLMQRSAVLEDINACELRWTRLRLALKRKFFVVVLVYGKRGSTKHADENSAAAAALTITRMQKSRNGSGNKNDILALRANEVFGITRKRPAFTDHARSVLRQWFHDHINHPFPSPREKKQLAKLCNLEVIQITNWMGNYRLRKWAKKKDDKQKVLKTSRKRAEKCKRPTCNG